MNRNTFIVSLALVALSSCKQIPGNFDSLGISDHYQSDKASKINLSDLKVGSVALYSDFFSSVKYVPLEATPNSLIGEISKLMVSKDGDYIVFSSHDKTVLRFSPEGKYLNTIGHVGHGSNEYEWPSCVAYDEFRNQVIIFDCAKCDLMFYTVDGELLNNIRMPKYISSCEVVDESHLALFLNHGGEYPHVDGLYNYVIVDREGKVSGYHAPYDEDRIDFSMLADVFSRSDGHTYCMIGETPIINEITANSLTTRYFVDFGGYCFPVELFEKTHEEYEKFSFNKPKDIARSWSFFKTGKNIFLDFSWNGDQHHLMIAKEGSLQCSTYMCQFDNDVYGLASSLDLLYASNGNAFFLLQPHECENLVDQTEVNQDLMPKFVTGYKKIAKAVESQDKELSKRLWNLSERYAKRGGSLIFTPEEKAEMLRLSKNNNPIIQVCTLK